MPEKSIKRQTIGSAGDWFRAVSQINKTQKQQKPQKDSKREELEKLSQDPIKPNRADN